MKVKNPPLVELGTGGTVPELEPVVVGTSSENYGTSDSFSINTPTNKQPGDLLIIHIFTRDVPSTPSGWTLVATSAIETSFSGRASVYSKISDGTEVGIGFTTSASGRYGGSCVAIRNANSIVDVTTPAQSTMATDYRYNMPSVTNSNPTTAICIESITHDLAATNDPEGLAAGVREGAILISKGVAASTGEANRQHVMSFRLESSETKPSESIYAPETTNPYVYTRLMVV